jgi:phage shock protein C
MPEDQRNFEEELATDAMPGSSQPQELATHEAGPAQRGPKRLYRSSDQRMLIGVCGGLAEYFDIDPTIVRILFILLIFAGFSGPLLYIALAIIMPSEDKLETHPREAARSTVDEAVQGVSNVVNQVSDWVRSKTSKSTSDQPSQSPPPSQNTPDF